MWVEEYRDYCEERYYVYEREILIPVENVIEIKQGICFEKDSLLEDLKCIAEDYTLVDIISDKFDFRDYTTKLRDYGCDDGYLIVKEYMLQDSWGNFLDESKMEIEVIEENLETGRCTRVLEVFDSLYEAVNFAREFKPEEGFERYVVFDSVDMGEFIEI